MLSRGVTFSHFRDSKALGVRACGPVCRARSPGRRECRRPQPQPLRILERRPHPPSELPRPECYEQTLLSSGSWSAAVWTRWERKPGACLCAPRLSLRLNRSPLGLESPALPGLCLSTGAVIVRVLWGLRLWVRWCLKPEGEKQLPAGLKAACLQLSRQPN